jgi:hypothetical protein
MALVPFIRLTYACLWYTVPLQSSVVSTGIEQSKRPTRYGPLARRGAARRSALMSSPQPGRSPAPFPPQVPAAGTPQAAGVTAPRPPVVRRYGLTLLSTGVAFAVRWLLNPALGGAGVFLPFLWGVPLNCRWVVHSVS